MAYAVVTLKDSAGNILYPSQVAAAAGSVEGASLTRPLIASVLKENGLVPVAKLAAFRDPIAARTDRNMAIGYTGQAYLWLDNKASAGGNLAQPLFRRGRPVHRRPHRRGAEHGL